MTENQKKVLEIYKIFAKVCSERGIQFWATGGTVLGAIRHNGFIPWDDDIDIALSRKDLDKLVSEFNDLFPSFYKLYWSPRGQQYRIVDIRYKVKIDDNSEGIFEAGQDICLYIDIQPFDGVPDFFVYRYIHSFNVMFWRSCLKVKDKTRLRKRRNLLERIVIFILCLFSFALPEASYLEDKYNCAMRKYDFYDNNYIADFVGRYLFKDIYPKSWWVPSVEMAFEDTTVPVPSNYDAYLSRIYGNYMKIPKEKEQHFADEAR